MCAPSFPSGVSDAPAKTQPHSCFRGVIEKRLLLCQSHANSLLLTIGEQHGLVHDKLSLFIGCRRGISCEASLWSSSCASLRQGYSNTLLLHSRRKDTLGRILPSEEKENIVS